MKRFMMGKQNIRGVILAAILGTAVLPGITQAVDEIEPNDPASSAQHLTIIVENGRPTGGVTVTGVLGNLTGAPVLDLDFYVFRGKAGDLVTVDIDGGMGGQRSVDTILGIFGPGPTYTLLRHNDDAGSPLDMGSTHPYDSRIDNFLLPATGDYTVGVSSYPRHFKNGGTTVSTALLSASNGDYTLVISGVSSPVLHINIDIKPGHDSSIAPINPKSKGKIPVALLGSADFNVRNVNVASLTFGHTGDEASLSKCPGREDVNDDGVLDLVCHFENQLAVFAFTDEEGILKGTLDDGRVFEGRGWLKVVPAKAVY
ncbi:MAG: hypothetical protein ABIO65_05800 [Nitrospiria bacterium]